MSVYEIGSVISAIVTNIKYVACVGYSERNVSIIDLAAGDRKPLPILTGHGHR
jgi:hypothetical protein